MSKTIKITTNEMHEQSKEFRKMPLKICRLIIITVNKNKFLQIRLFVFRDRQNERPKLFPIFILFFKPKHPYNKLQGPGLIPSRGPYLLFSGLGCVVLGKQ